MVARGFDNLSVTTLLSNEAMRKRHQIFVAKFFMVTEAHGTDCCTRRSLDLIMAPDNVQSNLQEQSCTLLT